MDWRVACIPLRPETYDEGVKLTSKKIVQWALLSGAVMLTGCATSPIPVAENFPLTVQPKVRSAGHWGLLSKDIVAQTLESVNKAGGASMALYVALPQNASEFDQAFRDFLITELVRAGRVVQHSPGNAMEVSYHAQVVRHNSPRPHFVPGGFTMLTAGLYAIYGLRLEHVDAKLAGGLALAGVADYVASAYTGGPTSTELVLTTTISAGERYLARKTDVYYVEEEDQMLFAALRTPKTMKVVGP